MAPPGESLLPRAFPGGCIRRLRLDDLQAFQAYRGIPDLGRYQGWQPVSDVEALGFLTEMSQAPLFAPGRWVQLGITEAKTDVLIGDIGLHLSDDGRKGEVGVTLHPAAQGRGLATAAVREALQVLFALTEVRQVLGTTDSRNLLSIRLLERLGFKYQESRNVIFREEPCSEHIYVLRRAGRQPRTQGGRF